MTLSKFDWSVWAINKPMRCTLLCIGILQPHVFVIFTLGLEGLHGEKHPRANNPEEKPDWEEGHKKIVMLELTGTDLHLEFSIDCSKLHI